MDILSSDPVDLTHPSWCSPVSCTAPDRLAERGVEETAVPISRRGAHFGEAHVVPAGRMSEVELRFELFRDVFVEVTDQPDGVQLSTHSEMCGHAHTLVLAAEQTGPLAVAAAVMRDAMHTDRHRSTDETSPRRTVSVEILTDELRERENNRRRFSDAYGNRTPIDPAARICVVFRLEGHSTAVPDVDTDRAEWSLPERFAWLAHQAAKRADHEHAELLLPATAAIEILRDEASS